MKKQTKTMLIILAIILLILAVYWYYYIKNKFIQGYAKKKSEWIAYNVESYNDKYYKGFNSANKEIYFLKSDVEIKKQNYNTFFVGKDIDTAYAINDTNVFTLRKLF